MGDYENIHSVNPLYLIFSGVHGFTKEKDGNKFLILDSTDENKEVLKTYTELWDGIKMKLRQWMVVENLSTPRIFWKLYLIQMMILPLNKPLKLPTVTIIVRSVFVGDGKLYSQIYLDECFDEL